MRPMRKEKTRQEKIELIPAYLRFIRGVVDCEDLPLNISRETIQHNLVLHKIRKAITKRILQELKDRAEKDPEEYLKFWNNFGPVLKEGLCEGSEPHEEIVQACRFYSTAAKNTLMSLDDYIKRMKAEQEEIYYILADDLESAANSPQLEGFKKRDIEVLLLTDHVDEFWTSVYHQYKEKSFKSVTSAGIDLDKIEPSKTEESKDTDKKPDDTNKLIDFFKETLGNEVADIRITSKLVDSPVCLTAPQGKMDIRMERFLLANKQISSSSAKILEINPNHSLISKLTDNISDSQKKEQARDIVKLLFAEANIIEGEPVSDIIGFTKRINEVIEKALKN